MTTKEAEKLVYNVWNRCKNHFFKNTPSERCHSWEQADETSLRALEEYFHGSAYRFSMLLTLAKQYLPEKAKVLDAGAGHGVLALALKDAGFNAAASDLHQGLAIFEEENIPYYQWHLEAHAAPFPDNSFDAVILSQTIEHFTYSPLKPLQELVRVLRPSGILIVDAPNISCFHNISRLFRGKSLHWNLKKHYLEQVAEVVDGVPYYDRHNHEYSYEDLLDIADYFDLKVENIAYYSSCNKKKRGQFAIFFSHIRDAVKRWRKGIYAVYRLPSDAKQANVGETFSSQKVTHRLQAEKTSSAHLLHVKPAEG
ncbi:MAG: class I SAM-dependent methyltransferase [Mariprofundaceae bacterium]|nr:class I SAM-dependent methyltransferase [Mariprofundaceae bacterium]